MTPGARPRTAMTQTEAVGLLMRHRTALYAFLYACLLDHHDAEDVLQDVSATVLRSFGDLRDEAGFLPWAREIARRCAMNHGRKGRREQSLDPQLVVALADAADRLERDRPGPQYEDALRACLAQLPPNSRGLIARRYDGSVGSVQELAREVGRSVQSVYATLKRIKGDLRQCVERRLAAKEPS